jgi:hypothetical protein
MSETKFKIRRPCGDFSKGAVTSDWDSINNTKTYKVTWDKNGKEWCTEKTLKSHLMKCAKCGILDQSWEILEVKYHPTKPIDEWIDQKMLIQILKNS